VENYLSGFNKDNLAGDDERRQGPEDLGEEPIPQRRPIDSKEQDCIDSEQASQMSGTLIGDSSTYLKPLLTENRSKIRPFHDS